MSNRITRKKTTGELLDHKQSCEKKIWCCIKHVKYSANLPPLQSTHHKPIGNSPHTKWQLFQCLLTTITYSQHIITKLPHAQSIRYMRTVNSHSVHYHYHYSFQTDIDCTIIADKLITSLNLFCQTRHSKQHVQTDGLLHLLGQASAQDNFLMLHIWYQPNVECVHRHLMAPPDALYGSNYG